VKGPGVHSRGAGFGKMEKRMAIEVLSVDRIGQISGTTDASWPLLVDLVGNSL